jgi:hypothetical protein
MGLFKDISGVQYSKLKVIKRSGTSKHGAIIWHCICDCGNEFRANGDSLKSGNTKSCGCLKRTLDGESTRKGSLYISWRAMMRRCYENNHHAFHRYGGRGISVCERWHNFNNFRNDLGEKPEFLELDRIDNDGNYSLNNCKWSSKSEQAFNRKNPWIKRRENLAESLRLLKEVQHEFNE